ERKKGSRGCRGSFGFARPGEDDGPGTIQGVLGRFLGLADALHHSWRHLRRRVYSHGSRGGGGFFGLIVGFAVYREIKLKDLPKILVESATTTAVVMLIIGAASVFAYIITVEGF